MQVFLQKQHNMIKRAQNSNWVALLSFYSERRACLRGLSVLAETGGAAPTPLRSTHNIVLAEKIESYEESDSQFNLFNWEVI